MSPRLNFQLYYNFNDHYIFNGAIGQTSLKDTTVPLNYKFKSASVAKSFVATLILQLSEDGKVNLDSPISNYLDPSIVKQLVVVDGVDYGSQITVRQLLNHTGGLSDYIFDDKRFVVHTLMFPRKAHSPLEHLEKYRKHNMYKKGTYIPGTSYHYSDTGYLLLALIIEKTSHRTLSEQLELKIIKPLNLKNTYLDNWDSTYTNTMHQYRNRKDVTKTLHPSVEFGGGGLICTTEDLAIFVKGLFDIKLFRDSSTLEQMTNINADNYGLGIYQFKIAEKYFDPLSTDSLVVYGHSGYFGVDMYHIPDLNITWANSIGQVSLRKVDALPPWFQMTLACYQYLPRKSKE